MNKNPYIAEAIEILHGQTSLANAIGRTQPMIWKLLHKKARVTTETALLIEAATGGKVSRHDLRPEFFGPKPERRTGTDRRNSKHSNPNGPERRQGERRNKAA